MKNIIHIGVILVLIIFLLTNNAYAHIIINETKTIDTNKSVDIKIPDTKTNDIIEIDIHVTKGGPIDIILMKSRDYLGYKQGNSFNTNVSFLNIDNKVYNYSILENGDYYLIIDNTDKPAQGAMPIGGVDIQTKIVHEEMEKSEPMRTSIPTAVATETVTISVTESEIKKTPGFILYDIIIIIILIILGKKL